MAYEWRELPDREGSIDENLVRHYKRSFQVIVDNPTYGPGEVAALVPLNMYASWAAGTDLDFRAILKKKSAKMTGMQDGGDVWIVECEYDSEPIGQKQGGTSPSGDPGQSETQPDMRPWQIEFGSVKTTKLLTTDAQGVNTKYVKADGTLVAGAGTEVAASNGQPFDPPPEIPAFHPQIQITAYKAMGTESFANVSAYTNKVNNGVWQGFAAETVLCTEYKLQSQYEHGQWWWQKTVTLEINPDGPWNPILILDAGTVYKESNAKPPQPILDSSGNPVTSPVPLNGLGMPLQAGQPLVYQAVNGFQKVNFAGII